MKSLILGTLLTLFTLGAVSAKNWPQWRGPNSDGSTEATGLPTKFSKTENVKWAADMPGPSAATPVVWGDRVFATSIDPEKETVVALCLDRNSGKELWRKDVAKGLKSDDRSNFASPSPVTDGKTVVFFFGTGDLVACDFNGTEIWKRNVQNDFGKFYFLWTFSTSPVLHDGRVILQILQRDMPVRDWQGKGKRDSFLVAFDLKTGKEQWKAVRPSRAKSESLEAFTTPVVHRKEDGSEVLLVAGGDCLTGHDPKTGKEIWRWGTWNPRRIGHWRLVPSPVAGAGVALACGPKKEPIYAVKLGEKGVLDDSKLAWVSEDKEISSDVSTPLFYGGLFYILHSDRNSLSCVEPKSGKIVWSERLDSRSKIEGSPTAADGKIYVQNFHGEVFVVKAGSQFELLHKVQMGEGKNERNRAAIAIAGANLFIRTQMKLFCIGE